MIFRFEACHNVRNAEIRTRKPDFASNPRPDTLNAQGRRIRNGPSPRGRSGTHLFARQRWVWVRVDTRNKQGRLCKLRFAHQKSVKDFHTGIYILGLALVLNVLPCFHEQVSKAFLPDKSRKDFIFLGEAFAGKYFIRGYVGADVFLPNDRIPSDHAMLSVEHASQFSTPCLLSDQPLEVCVTILTLSCQKPCRRLGERWGLT